jgi:tetratricopeptide (TPR) repeat protein
MYHRWLSQYEVNVKAIIHSILIIVLMIPTLSVTAGIIGNSSFSDPVAQDTSQVDMQKVFENWSLFYEDYRNGYYERAIPYGWRVMELHPTRFRTLYNSLAECYRQLYLKADPENRSVYADTMLIIFDQGIKHIPDRADSYHLQKAFIYDNYYSPPRVIEAIESYEKVVELSFETIDFQYLDRLGTLYLENMTPANNYESKAIDLYNRYLSERDPDNSTAMDKLRRLIRDPNELVRLAEEKLRTDPDNVANIWGVVQAYNTAEQYQKAIPHVERLTKLQPDSETYWSELARLHERTGNYRDAIRAYSQIMRINPNSKEAVLQVSRAYRSLGNFQQARTYAQRATRMDRGWGDPLMEIAAIYEEVVEQCVVNVKGGWANMKLEDRVVYKLAQEYYEQAANTDTRVANNARQRITFLANLIPQDEDYFFNREVIREGKIKIFGECYEWIDEEITVPPQFR